MIRFRQSRFKLALHAALSAAVSLMMAFSAFVAAHMEGLWPYAVLSITTPLIVAFAILAILHLLALRRPATLTADADGFVFASWRGERRIAWAEVESFTVFAQSSFLRSPGVELKEGARKFISFGRNWQNRPEEIVAGLEEKRGALTPRPE